MSFVLLAPVVGLLLVPPKPSVEAELPTGRVLSDVEVNRLSTSWWASDELEPCIVTNVERSRGLFSAPRERWEAAGFVPPAKPVGVAEAPDADAPDADAPNADAPKKRGPGRPRKERPEGVADGAPKKRGPRIDDPDKAGRGKQQSNMVYRVTALIDTLALEMGTTHAALVAEWVATGVAAQLNGLADEVRERVLAATEAKVAARRKELQDAAAGAPAPTPEPPSELIDDAAPSASEDTPAEVPSEPTGVVPEQQEEAPAAVEAALNTPPEPKEAPADPNVIAAAGVDVPPPPPATGPSPRKAPTKSKSKSKK